MNLKRGRFAYQPTKKELALLEVLLDPTHRLKSVVDQCRVADVNRDTYYHAFQKPGFAALYREMSIAITKQHIAPVINACVREAVRGSYHHAKIVLGMADVYHERKEVTGKDGAPLNPIEQMTDEQLETRARELASEILKEGK